MGSADHESAIPGLLGTCALMFFGAYGCGMLPSWVSISEQRLSNVGVAVALSLEVLLDLGASPVSLQGSTEVQQCKP
jgi:hypothetical protein